MILFKPLRALMALNHPAKCKIFMGRIRAKVKMCPSGLYKGTVGLSGASNPPSAVKEL